MGLNAYLEAADSYGFTNASTSGVTLVHNIAPRSGKRISILAFGATASEVATNLYFMQTLGATTVSVAGVSGATTIEFTANPGPSGNAMATADYVCVALDDGTYQFSYIANASPIASLRLQLASALTDTVAAGNALYMLGVRGDTGHLRVALTASTQSTKDRDLGIFFGEAKGYPMRVELPPAGSTSGSIDYITVGFMNK